MQDQIRRNLRIWPHILKKSVMENFIFCAVWVVHATTSLIYEWTDSLTSSIALLKWSSIIRSLLNRSFWKCFSPKLKKRRIDSTFSWNNWGEVFIFVKQVFTLIFTLRRHRYQSHAETYPKKFFKSSKLIYGIVVNFCQ